jgi:hypothetical protein
MMSDVKQTRHYCPAMDSGDKSRKSHKNPQNPAILAFLDVPIFWLGTVLSASFPALSLGAARGSPKHKKQGHFRHPWEPEKQGT